MTFIVSGEMNMLCKSKRSKNGVRKRCRICAVGIDVYIEVSSYDDSDGDEMKNSSSAGNSWKNVAILEDGGRYMLMKMICLFP